jgi:hypothetical protein
MHSTHRIIVPVLLAAALAFAGCGGSGNKNDNRGYRGYPASGGGDVAAVDQAIHDYFAAIVGGDYAKACSLISGPQKAKIEAGGQKCADLVSKGVSLTGKAAYEHPDIGTPKVSGDTATVHYALHGKGQSIGVDQKLVKEGDQWKLDNSKSSAG